MSTLLNQQQPLAYVPVQDRLLGTAGQPSTWQQDKTVGQSTWQQDQLGKSNFDSTDFQKRDFMFHQAQLPQGQQAVSLPANGGKQTLPVGVQGFSQGGLASQTGLSGEQPLLLSDKTMSLQQNQGVLMQQQQSFGQTGVIPLKPICIEQEAVTFRPQAITIEQPPLTVQPEAITIPQPPIVIHPEPIVIPQAPLVFQPPAVTLARQALTYQPEAITMARPSYSVQPLIQYDMRGCAHFAERDFKQHVHIRLTNEQIMRQQMGENWRGGEFVQSSTTVLPSQNVQQGYQGSNFQQQQQQQGNWQDNSNNNSNQQASGTSNAKPASFFSRDRNYNYGVPPTAGDKLKDSLGVANNGPQQPVDPQLQQQQQQSNWQSSDNTNQPTSPLSTNNRSVNNNYSGNNANSNDF